MEYFEWMETLQIDGRIPMDMPDDEFMDKIYRMLRCDQKFHFDPDGDGYF
jgi:predicted SAM-dependent methyltransferase